METRDDELLESPLWTFSLLHYAKPGVKQACLVLQDERGLDVNVALACLWHERHGGAPLSQEEMEQVLHAVGPAQRRVHAIRALRREAKDALGANAVYRALKRAELLAENLQQSVLFGLLRDLPRGDTGDGHASLQAYARHQRKTLPPQEVEAFAVE